MTISVEETALAGVRIVAASRAVDARGFFCEVYSRAAFAQAGMAADFVQDNLSLSLRRGTVRGLHFQAPPCGQDKLVRVTRGAILDVVVDLRRSSPTFGRHVAVELSAENGLQLYVPIGFAHGFCTLEDHTEVAYKVSSPYAPSHDGGLAWNDPALGIAWPVEAEAAILSERDGRHPRLADLASMFD